MPGVPCAIATASGELDALREVYKPSGRSRGVPVQRHAEPTKVAVGADDRCRSGPMTGALEDD